MLLHPHDHPEGGGVSNDLNAYGWTGHIAVAASDYGNEANEENNLVSFPHKQFSRLVKHYDDLKLDNRFSAKVLGITSTGIYYFMAIGTGFSNAFKYYGAPFKIDMDLDADTNYRHAI